MRGDFSFGLNRDYLITGGSEPMKDKVAKVAYCVSLAASEVRLLGLLCFFFFFLFFCVCVRVFLHV